MKQELCVYIQIMINMDFLLLVVLKQTHLGLINYYFYSYYELLRNGEIEESESINISVPTGNFGNILAGYLAKQMGLPIDILICASNKNNHQI